MTVPKKIIAIFSLLIVTPSSLLSQQDCTKCDLNHFPVAPECEKCWLVQSGVIGSVSESTVVLSTSDSAGKSADRAFELNAKTKKNAPLKAGARATVFYRKGRTTADKVELTEALDNLLTPASQPAPESICKPPVDAIRVYLGNNLAWTTGDHMIVLDIGAEQIVAMDRTQNGVAISAKIYDRAGTIIAQLVNNKFFLNRSNIFRIERESPSSLAVYDLQAREVLRAEYLNQFSIRVTGVFYGPNGRKVVVTKDAMLIDTNSISGNCFGGAGTAIKVATLYQKPVFSSQLELPTNH